MPPGGINVSAFEGGLDGMVALPASADVFGVVGQIRSVTCVVGRLIAIVAERVAPFSSAQLSRVVADRARQVP